MTLAEGRSRGEDLYTNGDMHSGVHEMVDVEGSGLCQGKQDGDARRDTEPDLDMARCQVDRHSIDEALFAHLQEAGFEGAEYDWFEEELVRYGWSVLDAWLRHGTIFARCARISRSVEPTDWQRRRLRESAEDREDLACTVVGFTIAKFRNDALVGGGWRPDAGASITTYFINRLVREFPNHFRAWQRLNQWEAIASPTEIREPVVTDPAEQVLQQAAVIEVLKKLKPREREIVTLHYDGFSHAAIAELTGAVSAKAVERVLARWRERQRELWNGGDHG